MIVVAVVVVIIVFLIWMLILFLQILLLQQLLITIRLIIMLMLMECERERSPRCHDSLDIRRTAAWCNACCRGSAPLRRRLWSAVRARGPGWPCAARRQSSGSGRWTSAWPWRSAAARRSSGPRAPARRPIRSRRTVGETWKNATVCETQSMKMCTPTVASFSNALHSQDRIQSTCLLMMRPCDDEKLSVITRKHVVQQVYLGQVDLCLWSWRTFTDKKIYLNCEKRCAY